MILPFYTHPIREYSALRTKLNDAYRMDEATAVQRLLEFVNFTPAVENEIHQLATKLVGSVREHQSERNHIEAFMMQYDLSMEEGILMMCLAEALLRVPDKDTEQLLLKDKLTSAKWEKHIGDSESSVVNIATWGLALSGKILRGSAKPGEYFKSVWGRLVRKSGEPLIRKCVREAMKILSKQFVIGQDIKDALKRSKDLIKKGYCFSYDMLGEVARTQKDADRYYQAYFDAITAIGQVNTGKSLIKGQSISVKLSALHPRYEFSDRESVVPYLIERVKTLVLHAKENNMSLTIDAEEADRLDMSLDIIEGVFSAPEVKDWEGLGLAMQAYQKRAFYLIDWLIDLARQQGKRIQVRLVKGAYWDTEVKLSQVEGFDDYPVFTRKASTDLSYLACAKKMLQAQDAIYPQFATHNAYSVASIVTLLGDNDDKYQFEFQSLQGMGRALHDEILDAKRLNLPCRIYAPVGTHQDLLPYLVRRLLENGANSSFVNKIQDKKVPVDQLIKSPIKEIQSYASITNAKIPLPKAIYGRKRVNSVGTDLSDIKVQEELARSFNAAAREQWTAAPFLREVKAAKSVFSPINLSDKVGEVELASKEDVFIAMDQAQKAFPAWSREPVVQRAALLRKVADLFESHQYELMYLAVREAGKTLLDAVAELREAVDFCRYYADQAEQTLADKVMPGPTGELNVLRMRGRGVVLCISPWNFPLAIFTGQIAAALVAGNVVIAKPAEQTSLIAARAVQLFYEAGFPTEVLQLLPGKGQDVGNLLVEHQATAGVMFTGSTETAYHIQKALVNRGGPIIPLVAETGGMNAMIADSTALSEQLVRDVLISAFGSAGQRCSALRILYIQEDIAEAVLAMLAGAMAELSVGNPMLLSSDVGPVIDSDAAQMLADHASRMKKVARLIYECKKQPGCDQGNFVPPQAYELSDASVLKREVFGPILHVVRYASKDLDKVIDQINGFGYGLTFGIQSRINSTVEYIQDRINVGNIYVNRNMVGAVVGVQPFGGCGLSGTGPKAGGPHYLSRLCQENTLSVDTTAVGGNASLMAMED